MKPEGMHPRRSSRKGRLNLETTECAEMHKEQPEDDLPVVETDIDQLLQAALRYWETSHLSGE
jgi:hypothetical protein